MPDSTAKDVQEKRGPAARKMVVLGRTGQVGRALARTLAPSPDLVLLDRRQADLTDPDRVRAVIAAHAPDVVVNAAAHTAVDRAEEEPELAAAVNAESAAAMAEACAETGAWLISYSTDYVFDGRADHAYRENDAVAPANVYGRTKLAGEEAIRRGLPRHLIFRTSWVYSNDGSNFLNTMLRLADEREELRIVDDQWGAPTWAGAIADGTVRVLEWLMAHPEEADAVAGTYHMTCAGRTTWYGFARRIFERTARLDRLRLEPIATADYPTPAVRPAWSVLSNEKLERVFGVRLPDWDEALRRCLEERGVLTPVPPRS